MVGGEDHVIACAVRAVRNRLRRARPVQYQPGVHIGLKIFPIRVSRSSMARESIVLLSQRILFERVPNSTCVLPPSPGFETRSSIGHRPKYALALNHPQSESCHPTIGHPNTRAARARQTAARRQRRCSSARRAQERGILVRLVFGFRGR